MLNVTCVGKHATTRKLRYNCSTTFLKRKGKNPEIRKKYITKIGKKTQILEKKYIKLEKNRKN